MFVSIEDRMTEKPHDTRCTRVNVLCCGHVNMLTQMYWSRRLCSGITRKMYRNPCVSDNSRLHVAMLDCSTGFNHLSHPKCQILFVCVSRTVIWLRNLQQRITNSELLLIEKRKADYLFLAMIMITVHCHQDAYSDTSM